MFRNLNYKISILEKENERLRAERDLERKSREAAVKCADEAQDRLQTVLNRAADSAEAGVEAGPERIYPEDMMRSGGKWLGAVRNRIKWIRCGGGNGERITWGSDEKVDPPLSMKEVEQLAAEASAAALNERQDALIAERDALRREVERLARQCELHQKTVHRIQKRAEAKLAERDKGAVPTKRLCDYPNCTNEAEEFSETAHRCCKHGYLTRGSNG